MANNGSFLSLIFFSYYSLEECLFFYFHVIQSLHFFHSVCVCVCVWERERERGGRIDTFYLTAKVYVKITNITPKILQLFQKYICLQFF